MKKILLLFVSVLFVTSFVGCENDLDNEDSSDNTSLLDINVKSTFTTEDSIELEWTDVKGVSWYFVEYNITGKDKQETGGYQQLESETISYTLDGLESGKEYEIIVTGRTYLSGGELVAKSKKIKVSTK